MKYTHILVYQKLIYPIIGDDNITEDDWENGVIWIEEKDFVYWSKQYQKMWEDKRYRNIHLFKL